MRADCRFVTFYTTTPPRDYTQSVRCLQESASAYGVELYAQAMPDLGSWISAVRSKPQFILDRMLDSPEAAVCWIDADAEFTADPALLYWMINEPVDLAVHFRDGRELVAGLLWLRNTHRVRELVRLWVKTCEKAAGVWEQKVLQGILPDIQWIRVYDLPTEYCAIDDIQEPNDRGRVIRPVIRQHQFSRKIRAEGSDPCA